MKVTGRKSSGALAATLAVALSVSGSSAQEFGSDITLIVGFSAGAGYDLFARTAAAHLPDHLPGHPNVLVDNAPGAGSLRLLRQYLATGKTDGTELAMISTGLALDAMLDPGIGYDPRTWNWIVSFSNYPTYCIATVASGVTNLDEMLAKPDFVIGSAGQDATYLASLAINNALGGHFRMVTGFEGVAEVNLAMARGDVDGVCGRSYGSLSRLAETLEFRVIAELSPTRFDLVDGAEYLLDRVEDALTRQALSAMFAQNLFWFPIVAHPDTPPEVVTALRAAFAALATDEDFLTEARTRLLDVAITDGATVQQLVSDLFNTDPAVVDRIRTLVTPP